MSNSSYIFIYNFIYFFAWALHFSDILILILSLHSQNFMPAMENLDDLPRNLVGKKNIVFSNLQQLLEFNRQ